MYGAGEYGSYDSPTGEVTGFFAGPDTPCAGTALAVPEDLK